MTPFGRIAVLIDEPSWARNVLLFTKELAHVGATRHIHLVQIVEEPEPAGWSTLAATEGMLVPLKEPTHAELKERIEKARTELQGLATEYFSDPRDLTIERHVITGSPLYESLRFGMENDIDLIVMGRHFGRTESVDESATTARRITRKATCSVLVVPEACDTLPTRILCPVRDSECSSLALESACSLAAYTTGSVFPINLFPLRDQITMLRGPIEEIVAAVERSAKAECERLIARTNTHDIPLEPICRADRDGRPAEKFIETLDHLAADAIVIGARGRTGAAGILLGKVTEKLIEKSPVPLLAVKKKGEQIGILKAILTLAQS